jgi:hypothetical protein
MDMINFYKKTKANLFVVAFLITYNSGLKGQVSTQTFSYTGSLQSFTIPMLCVNTITIEARGAGGGSVSTSCVGNGGLGARMIGEFSVTPGQVLTILVGQAGISNGSDAGGGGGSFVVAQSTVPLIVGGGGGGASNNITNCGANINGLNATITTTATASGNNLVAGGINGNGGGASSGSGGGGGGFYTNGTPGSGNANGYGRAFVNGGAGGIGSNNNHGGFGGGGCGWQTGGNGGGGGGYSGGGTSGSNPYSAGGGGASFNSGSNQNNTAGVQAGNGLVIITYNLGTPITVSMSPLAVCSGSSAVISASGMNSYTWSTGAQTPSISVSPTVSTSYTVQGTNAQNCISTSVVNVTVSNGLPVLAINSSTNNLCLGKTATLTASGALSYTWNNGVTNGVSFTPSVTNNYTVVGENGCGTTTAVTSITVAPLAMSVLNTPSITCAGQPSTLTAVASASGYTWQPFNLSGTTVVVNPTVSTVFTVTASDGTCSGVANLSLNVLPIPTINIVASTSAVCIGQSVNMTASGGLSYTWNPGNLSGSSVTVSPTGPTLYTVTGDNSVGCTSGTNQIVLTNTSPIVNISASSTLICSGDLLVLYAGGNASGYSWTNGPSAPSHTVNPSANSVYTVIGSSSSNTCTTTKTIEINVFGPALSIISSSSTVCSGSSVTLTASGADDYNWNNGTTGPQATENPTTTTVYTVIATSHTINNLSCSNTGTIQISVNPNPTVTASSTKTLICKGESTTLNAGGALNYLWSTSSSVPTITVAPSAITIHNYSLTGTDANGCSSTASITVRVISCNSIGENDWVNSNLNAYPNPSSGFFTVESDRTMHLSIVNVLGQEIKTISLNVSNNFKVNVFGLKTGIYFIKGNENQNLNHKIVIE